RRSSPPCCEDRPFQPARQDRAEGSTRRCGPSQPEGAAERPRSFTGFPRFLAIANNGPGAEVGGLPASVEQVRDLISQLLPTHVRSFLRTRSNRCARG